MSHFSDEDGKLAVRAAREAIESIITGGQPPGIKLPDKFEEKGGVFVTIKTFPAEELRGCIGYPEPLFSLREAIPDSAVSAATRDPRFPPLFEQELPNIVVEVSLLTPPEEMKYDNQDELLKQVRIGEDGLIVESGYARGLLLPQVPVEWDWDSKTFLEHTCLKAGLPIDAWKSPKTKFYRFQAEIFSEKNPKGDIVRKSLSDQDGCGNRG
ncbi:MAG TPA: TIGR00296 family protein [Euryarchaeota archaeon]|nr:TIGR00296 family protein [Euryarchaeota archaeon]